MNAVDLQKYHAGGEVREKDKKIYYDEVKTKKALHGFGFKCIDAKKQHEIDTMEEK